jgi:hypothetical protein
VGLLRRDPERVERNMEHRAGALELDRQEKPPACRPGIMDRRGVPRNLEELPQCVVLHGIEGGGVPGLHLRKPRSATRFGFQPPRIAWRFFPKDFLERLPLLPAHRVLQIQESSVSSPPRANLRCLTIVRKRPIRLHFLQLMTKLLISFEKRNLRLRSGRWLFKRAWPMRFEWVALMAYKRLTMPGDQAWVGLDEIARLPSWGGKSRHDTSTKVGRYLQSAEFEQVPLVTARNKWSGPFRLNTDSPSIEIDLSLPEVRKSLRLRKPPTTVAWRAALIRFALLFTRAQWLFFRGRLERKGPKDVFGNNAYEMLMQMVDDRSFTPTLQILALLSAVDVLFRLSRFQAARHTLMGHQHRIHRCEDPSLQARFHLKLAWTFQRVSSGIRSDRAVEAALQKANFHAENSGDRATLGLLAHRTALYQTKKGFHLDAVNQLVLALEADLIIGNYDNVQAACGDIGSIIHRLGPKYYGEARCWLLLSIAVARMMKLGRDDAHAEMILGKIYVEQGYPLRSRWLLERAERIAARAGNRVNLADVKMVWGFWYERFGSRKQLIESLINALSGFRNLSEFDVRQKEKYMERSFPVVWQDVEAACKTPKQRATAHVKTSPKARCDS